MERKVVTSRDSPTPRFLPCKPNSEHLLGSEVSGNERTLSPRRHRAQRKDFDGKVSGELFLNTLRHLLFKMNPKSEALARRLPDNAKYTSPDVQNKVYPDFGYYATVKENIATGCQN